MHRGDDPRRHADQHRNDERHDAKLQRHRQLLRDQLRHRLADAPGIPEIALQHVAHPVQVLHRQRPIEPQLGADLRQHLRIAALLAGQHQRRIARHELLQAEHQHADQQQRRNDLRDARAEMSAHYLRHLQALQADHAVRHRAEAVQLRRHADDVARRVQIDDRQVLPLLRHICCVERLAACAMSVMPRACVQQLVHRRVAVVADVVAPGRVCRNCIGVAVDIDAAGPADQVGLEVAALPTACSDGGELHRLDVHVEAGLGGHRLDHLGRLQRCRGCWTSAVRACTGSVTPACCSSALAFATSRAGGLQRRRRRTASCRAPPARSARYMPLNTTFTSAVAVDRQRRTPGAPARSCRTGCPRAGRWPGCW